MAYRRQPHAQTLPTGEDLTAAMVGIGMLFSTQAAGEPNIEDTIVAASIEGMDRDDLRVLAILVTWLGVHHPRVNVDRLCRALDSLESARVRAFWAAVGAWLAKDRRFTRLHDLYAGERIDVQRAGAEFLLKRAGEDPRFAGTPLRVAAGVLRDRPQDVLTPAVLAKRHSTYRHRILMGPSYRADMWAALERDPSLTAAELARKTYGSFATAWQVKHDRELLAA